MNDLARQRLCDMIAERGSAVCNTPMMCELFLRQKCADHPDELQLLTQALKSGLVSQLQGLRDVTQWEAASTRLVNEFAEAAELSTEQARWAVDSWAIALRKHPEAAPPPPPEAAKAEAANSQPRPGRMEFQLLLSVSVAGGAGGLVGGALVGILNALVFTAIEHPELGWIIAVLTIITGTVGGAVGSVGAWLMIGAHTTAEWPKDGTVPLYVYRGFAGAFGGALFGAGVLGYLRGGSPFAVFFGAALGGFTGALTGVWRG